MFEIKTTDIIKYYKKIKDFAFKKYSKGDYEGAIHQVDMAAIVMYNLNNIYRDFDFETLLSDISKKILSQRITNYNSIKERFVFYDQIGNSSVLGLQYVRALISWNVEFLYILEQGRHTRPQQILAEVRSYNKATVLILDQQSYVERIETAYKTIVDYRPEKAFLHAPAEGACGVVLWNALSQIERYRIVPGDHHFYLGTSVTDYAIEFRNFGVAIALEKRGFKIEQILKQSYYPIVIETEFQGFPLEVSSDKVIMFSGGAFYKTYGKKDAYFKIVKRLLDENSQLLILFAGTGVDEPFKKFITDNNYQNRLILLGYRNDISALFMKIDIYLGTYPICGGLMSQYAAYSAKPIVQYNTSDLAVNSLEGIIDYSNSQRKIEITDLDTLCNYAKRLIDDKTFREKEGFDLKERIITESVFCDNLKKKISNNLCEDLMKSLPQINYDIIPENYMETANRYTHIYEMFFLYNYRFSAFCFFPKVFINALMSKLLYVKLFKSMKRVKYKK